MESFKPSRLKINLRLFLFIAVVSALFIWALYAGAGMLLHGGISTHQVVEEVGGYKKIELKALGEFNLDAVKGSINDVPERYRNIDGKKVVLEGFMWSPNGAAQLHDFQFVHSIRSKGPPLVQERVFAHSPVVLPYVGDECRVFGTLHVRVEKNEDGVIASVYTIDVDKWQEM